MSYAFLITRDHLEPAEERLILRGHGEDSDALASELRKGLPNGVIASTWAREYFTFKLYDDDDILYYTGKLGVSGDDREPGGGVSEDACFAPLSWGMRDSGCTSVRYPGHPEMDC